VTPDIHRMDHKQLLGLDIKGRPCEVCDQDMHRHAWADVDLTGFVVACSRPTPTRAKPTRPTGPLYFDCAECGSTYATARDLRKAHRRQLRWAVRAERGINRWGGVVALLVGLLYTYPFCAECLHD
jgi:hypothetical protein